MKTKVVNEVARRMRVLKEEVHEGAVNISIYDSVAWPSSIMVNTNPKITIITLNVSGLSHSIKSV